MENTLIILKPDAVGDNLVGEILSRFEADGLKIITLKRISLTERQAKSFYAEHEGKDFFEGLVDFMTSGPIVPVALTGDNAVQRARSLMGATNPEEAVPGSIRAEFGAGMPDNAVHGSDSNQSAQRELSFFFAELDLINE